MGAGSYRALENRIRSLEETLDKERKDTDISWGYSASGEAKGFLPSYVPVFFHIDGHSHHEMLTCRLAVEGGRRFLDIMGGDSVMVEPRASNLLRVYLQRP